MKSLFGKCENEIINLVLKRSTSCDLQTPSAILVFSACTENQIYFFSTAPGEEQLGRFAVRKSKYY